MNTKKQLSLAWTIVAILAVLLAVAAYFLANPAAGAQNLTQKRDMIREHCAGTDQLSRDACAQDLQDLGDLLRTFEKKPAATEVNTGATVKFGQ